ncbi:MAG: GTP-binding protein [Candidatus Heimdallarchaeota archaeon]|nr:GTP-binding protein [Candidatus Heimdallarchaeota archaeon]
MSYKATFKILLLGDGAVGKTAVVQRFVHGKFQANYQMTIGMEPYSRYEAIDGVKVVYSLWDIAGQDKFKAMRQIFFQGAKGTIIVFDLTRRETFEHVKSWTEESKAEADDQLLLLIGNKHDLEDEREVSFSQAKELSEQLGFIDYIETSAKTGVNVEEAFRQLGKELLRKHAPKNR